MKQLPNPKKQTAAYYAVFGLIFLLLAFCLVQFSLQHSGGMLVYALDDPYIHMSMARTFATHGVWGITPESFTSSTSSPAWVLLLAGFHLLLGDSEVLPLILNFLAGLGAFFAAMLILTHNRRMKPQIAAPVALGIVLLTPLLPLLMTGQEHILHCGLSLLYVHGASLWLAALDRHRQKSGRFIAAMLFLAFVFPMVRYESLFIIAAFSLLFLYRRQWLPAFGLPAAAATSVGLYGLISMAHGWPPLPASILLKSRWVTQATVQAGVPKEGAGSHILGALRDISSAGHLWMVLLLLFVAALPVAIRVFRQKRSVEQQTVPPGGYGEYLLAGSILTMLMHLVLIDQGGVLGRYDAFVMCIGLTAFTATVPADRIVMWWRGREPRNKILIACGALLLSICMASMFSRAYSETANAPYAVENIYRQQYQMVRFLNSHYPGKTVAINDVGIASYHGNFRIFDIWGLTNLDIARMWMEDRRKHQDMFALADKAGVELAVVYPKLLMEAYDYSTAQSVGPGCNQWCVKGVWQISKPVSVYDTMVGVYAVGSKSDPGLKETFTRFHATLPSATQ